VIETCNKHVWRYVDPKSNGFGSENHGLKILVFFHKGPPLLKFRNMPAAEPFSGQFQPFLKNLFWSSTKINSRYAGVYIIKISPSHGSLALACAKLRIRGTFLKNWDFGAKNRPKKAPKWPFLVILAIFETPIWPFSKKTAPVTRKNDQIMEQTHSVYCLRLLACQKHEKTTVSPYFLTFRPPTSPIWLNRHFETAQITVKGL